MKHLSLAAAVTAVSTPALAHPGDHHEIVGVTETVGHFLGTPFHLALLLGAVVVGFLCVRAVRSARNKNSH